MAEPETPSPPAIPASIPKDQPFELIAVVTSVPGTEDELEPFLNSVAQATVANEPGALVFQLYRALQHPGGGTDFIVRER